MLRSTNDSPDHFLLLKERKSSQCGVIQHKDPSVSLMESVSVGNMEGVPSCLLVSKMSWLQEEHITFFSLIAMTFNICCCAIIEPILVSFWLSFYLNQQHVSEFSATLCLSFTQDLGLEAYGKAYSFCVIAFFLMMKVSLIFYN